MSAGRPEPVVPISRAEVDELLRRVQTTLAPQDFTLVKAIIESYLLMSGLLEDKRTTIERLRKLLFGATSEKTAQVFAAAAAAAEASAEAPRPPAKGHGRNGADRYPGAATKSVRHATLIRGAKCPTCNKGKLYDHVEPHRLVRVTGQAPLAATIYELEGLRCNLCGKVHVAAAPPEVGDEKYDAAAAAMIGMLKYGAGTPFYRLEQLQRNFGVPLPASTQWEVVDAAAEELAPAHDELLRQAAQGDVVYNDDTHMTVLALQAAAKEALAAAEAAAPEAAAPEDAAPEAETPEDGAPEAADDRRPRTGTFTSGIVSTKEERRIALFFTGRQHAGENLRDVLRARPATTAPPIQMCDPLSRNMPPDLQSVIANCLAHGRRQFADVAESFPVECRHVLEQLRLVYVVDAETKERRLSPADRLQAHQARSKPVLDALRTWFDRQFAEKKVEPNSGLGAAIKYMTKRWDQLTLFLRQPGAPLDNNLCERVLKRAILHRKNALFFRSERGAQVGDRFMSLIHTAELAGAPAFDYLVALLRNVPAVRADPAQWMPWNYPRGPNAGA